MTTFPFISGQNKHWGEHIYICWLRNGEQIFNILILNQPSNFCETLLTASTCKIDPDLQELPFSSIHKIRPWKGHSIWSLCFEYLDTYEIIVLNQFCKTVWYVMDEENVVIMQRSFSNYLRASLESLVSQWHEGHALVTLIFKVQK